MAINSQIECFELNMKYWKFLGIYPYKINWRYYQYFSVLMIGIFVILYLALYTLNFFVLAKQLDTFIEETIFYFTLVASGSKALTFVFMKTKIVEILNYLEIQTFKPNTDTEIQIVDAAKKFNKTYWKMVAVVSYTSNITHVLSPLIAHIALSTPLELPVTSYSFLSENFKLTFIYPLYLYQSVGIHVLMLFNVNIDTFFLGLMILVIAQLDILDEKLRNVVPITPSETNKESMREFEEHNIVTAANLKLKNCVGHFDKVAKFCSLIEDVFSVTVFIQFGMASCIICVCLFRFTLPAPWPYYIFLATYMFVMVIQIMVPCWFGSRIVDKSCLLSQSIYSTNWMQLKDRRFRSSMRLFVERANRPIIITGWKMFPLSLKTFASIMNSAYSFFTLLQHVQLN